MTVGHMNGKAESGMHLRSVDYFASEETATLELGDGIWVELKRELDYGEESELEGAAIRAGINPDGTAKFEYSLRNQRSLLLALYVVDWNLTDQRGKPVALPDNIIRRQDVVSRLGGRTARRIAAKIDEIRAEEAAAGAISLKDLEDVELDPTEPGNAAELATRLLSDDGSEASATGKSRGRRPGSSKRR